MGFVANFIRVAAVQNFEDCLTKLQRV